jgi:hypothetical protein
LDGNVHAVKRVCDLMDKYDSGFSEGGQALALAEINNSLIVV